jgi:hypothetical protein
LCRDLLPSSRCPSLLLLLSSPGRFLISTVSTSFFFALLYCEPDTRPFPCLKKHLPAKCVAPHTPHASASKATHRPASIPMSPLFHSSSLVLSRAHCTS